MSYSLMTVLHELVFSFENTCNLYNIVENIMLHYILIEQNIRYILAFIIVYNKISIIEKNNLLLI